jgi:hypothetical protein
MLEVLAGYLDARPHVGMAFCDPTYIDRFGHPASPSVITFPRYVPGGLAAKQVPRDDPETPFVTVFSLIFTTPSVSVLRRSTYQESPGWDERFGQPFEDIDLFLQIALRGTIHYVPRQLVRYRRHGHQSTADPVKSDAQEFKLFEKWMTSRTLTSEERAVVTAAWRFRQGRLVPYGLMRTAARCLREGRLWTALRFTGAALRRYLLSLLPDEPRRLRLLYLCYKHVRNR